MALATEGDVGNGGEFVDLVGLQCHCARTYLLSQGFKDASGKKLTAGVVLYDGESAVRFADDLFAVPIKALWSMK